MIPAVRGRQSFNDLRRHGRRSTAGALRILFHADVTPSPRLAFAINRRVGTAVVRNRARRQLRVVMAQLAADDPELIPPGDYLVGVHRAGFTPEEARQWLTQALDQLRKP